MRVLIGLLAAAFLAACAATSTPVANLAPTATATEPARITDTRALIKAYAEQNRFSGAVLIAKDGQPVFREAFGYANRELNVAATPETVFRLASITKQFTAAAILKLAEQGKLSIDDPANKYYTNAPAAWAPITIRHLLSHRSGIGDYTSLPNFFEKLAATDRTPAEILDMTRDQPLSSKPGERFAYNNSGYVLLGYIIEKVSGQSYADYMEANFFQPLGMTHTGYDVSTEILPNRASGYGYSGDQWTNAAYLSMTMPYAAGSLYSTVDDLLIWEEALFSGRVISADSFKQMTTSQGDKYAFGLLIDSLEGHANIWHNGGINGFSTHMSRFPDDGLTVIVLSNLETSPAGRIVTDIARLWLGIPAPAALVAVDLPAEILDRYVGVYSLLPEMNMTLTRVDGKLMAQADGQSAFPLIATSPTEFHFPPSEIRIVFPAGEGPAPGFTLHQGIELQAKRLPPPN